MSTDRPMSTNEATKYLVSICSIVRAISQKATHLGVAFVYYITFSIAPEAANALQNY